MSTMFRRKQAREKHDPGIADLTLCFCSGCGTGVIVTLIFFGWFWR